MVRVIIKIRDFSDPDKDDNYFYKYDLKYQTVFWLKVRNDDQGNCSVLTCLEDYFKPKPYKHLIDAT